MAPPQPRSFRRLLIVRLMLLGIPILLVGQYFTLRKGRTSLLETARQNLTSSAVRKGDEVEQGVSLLRGNLQTLAATTALQGQDATAIAAQMDQFLTQMPLTTACLQVNQGASDTVVANTCPTDLDLPPLPWADVPDPEASSFYLVGLESAPPEATEPLTPSPGATAAAEAEADTPSPYTTLEVTLATPVYGEDGSLRYTLTLNAQIQQMENTGARSLVGHTVIIDEAGMIQAHPDPEQVGLPLSAVEGGDRLGILVQRAQAGDQETLHLFSFLPSHDEWLAGYAPLPVAITPGQAETWTVLAVTPLDHALEGLREIRTALVIFTLGLLGAQGILVLVLASRLSNPIERLAAYAQSLQDFSHFPGVPQNFHVWELDHLAKVLNRMLKRLEQRARELEHAWQDAQLANQLKSEFLANTSHELRTPLNAIIGCIRLVRDGCCDDEAEVQDFLDKADQAAIHLLDIINDILDLAKIEAGTLELYTEPLDARQVIAEVLDLQRVPAQQKGIRLIISPLTEPLWVEADRSKLKQVLLNVVSNAIKFTEQGEVEITVALERDPLDSPHSSGSSGSPHSSNFPNVSDGAAADHLAVPTLPPVITLPTSAPRLVIAIRDTGIGVDPRQQDKLFKPFVMADGSTTRQFEGTGLGLAISRNLLALMNGSITLYSEGLNRGSLVALALPLLDEAEIPPEEQDSPQPARRPKLSAQQA